MSEESTREDMIEEEENIPLEFETLIVHNVLDEYLLTQPTDYNTLYKIFDFLCNKYNNLNSEEKQYKHRLLDKYYKLVKYLKNKPNISNNYYNILKNIGKDMKCNISMGDRIQHVIIGGTKLSRKINKSNKKKSTKRRPTKRRPTKRRRSIKKRR